MIGILGGTFDPVHYGHLRPALEVMESLGLDQMRFIPNSIPPHREQPWLDSQQRLQLLQLAIGDQPGFELDQRELERTGHSYMVDTLASLQDDFPGTPLCLVLGMDAFMGLKDWHQWQRIPGLCHLVVTTRPGAVLEQAFLQDIPAELVNSADELGLKAHGRILLKSVTQLDISASQIRQALKQGRSARYLMPDAVYDKLLTMVND
jgi:nicotinate-nucleotide adenylyltransferase